MEIRHFSKQRRHILCSPIMNITDEIMNEDLGTKLFGAIYMIQAVIPSMKKIKWVQL